MKNLIKCADSFFIGFYLSFVLTLSITGYIIVKEFVSKQSLLTKVVFIDGVRYTVQKAK